jgi:dipeptidyl aminopeptidase/acylaminoacyl peptidase
MFNKPWLLWNAMTASAIATAERRGDFLDTGVKVCSFSSDGTRIILGGVYGGLYLFDGTRGQQIARLEGHTGGIVDTRFSPDGARVISGSEDKTVRLWDAATGKELFTLAGHKDKSPDGSTIVSKSSTYFGYLTVFDATTGENLAVRGDGRSNGPYCIAFSPDGRRILSADAEKVEAWDGLASQAGNCRFDDAGLARVPRTIIRTPISSSALSRDRTRILTASGSRLTVWDTTAGDEVARLSLHKEQVSACCLSPDGKLVVYIANNKEIKLWDVAANEQVATLASIAKDLSTRVADRLAEMYLKRAIRRQSMNVCAFSPDGLRIVCSSDDETVKIWDTKGHELCEYSVGEEPTAVGWSPDGRRLVVTSERGTVHLLALENVRLGPPLIGVWISPRDGSCAIGCPICGVWSAISSPKRSTEVPCPSCGEQVRLGDSPINAEWRPVADTWRAQQE